jgi:hypothetical protein
MQRSAKRLPPMCPEADDVEPVICPHRTPRTPQSYPISPVHQRPAADAVDASTHTHPSNMTTTDSKPLTSQEVNNARFNAEAAAWDSNKKHVESVQKAFEAILRYVPEFADGRGKSTSSHVADNQTHR